ncbi:hypothetical protein [Streptomyces sp. NPDC092307]|uniref:hypothetical protein n=1 Tax=Streptomyces sp. NPDC092307 TaxID=3366013 RepID=UPI00381EBDA3
MEENEILSRINAVIMRRNHYLAQAAQLWSAGQRCSYGIGRLVGQALAMGMHPTDVGQLLEAAQQRGPALVAENRAFGRKIVTARWKTNADPADGGPVQPVRGTNALPVVQDPAAGRPAVPAQRRKADLSTPVSTRPGSVPAPLRVLHIVREALDEDGINVEALMRRMGAEGYTVNNRQVRRWLDEWCKKQVIRPMPGGRYRPTDGPQLPLAMAASKAAPLLLRRAHLIVAAAKGGEMSTRDLTAALNAGAGREEVGGADVRAVGAKLSAQLRKVGVTRPNGGRIQAKYCGGVLVGFTAETLGRAITAYNALEERTSGQTGVCGP